MNVRELRRILKTENARWTIPANIADDIQLEVLSKRFALGALQPTAGTPTARMPKIRRIDTNFAPWLPNTLRIRRPFIPILPKSWDWRNVHGSNWVSPPKDQGDCGSCVAFGVIAALESHQRIEKSNARLTIDESEANLFFVNERQCNFGDPRYGWFVQSALDYLVNQGSCPEMSYPYQPVNQNAELVEGTLRTLKIHGYDSTTNVTLMKRWLCEEGPLIACYTVYEDFYWYWNLGANDVYTYSTGNVNGRHCVTVIGYDDAQSCWICKNSWGANGKDGCFRIGYGQCGIDDRMYLIQDVQDILTLDEIGYNPRTLRIVDEGARGWLLTDGRSRMKMFDNREDARNGMAVARRYTRQGFVGRDNPRTNRRDYITEYWAGNSGLPWEPLTKVDCIPYNPNNVVAEDIDADGWSIKEGNQYMLRADDLNDALAILRIVERYTKLCFIGRSNSRPNRNNYIMTYWE